MSSVPVPFRTDRLRVGPLSLHVTEVGDPDAPAVLFLHGWPESSRSWQPVMALAAAEYRAVAIDLPGIGGSVGAATDGSKAELAAAVRRVVGALGLRDPVLVGQDVGGMITYSYLRAYGGGLRAAVIMDVVIPGLDPWATVIANPYLWHFALHAVPGLPETLVQGNQRPYFDYFYDLLSAEPAAIPDEARDAYARAYGSTAALTAGFDWYRAFPADAERNAADTGPVDTPLLYLRGEHERGDIAEYLDGFRKVGLTNVQHGTVPGAGHFTQEEAPAATWRLIADFLRA
jgi:pimeloyl-ACP methyl ester carboxylesterase